MTMTAHAPDEPVKHFRVHWVTAGHGGGSSTYVQCCEAHLRAGWSPGELGLRITRVEDLGCVAQGEVRKEI